MIASEEFERIVLLHGARPGFRFAGAAVVGLPMYRFQLRVLASAERPLPTIEEFALRLIGCQIEEPSTLALLLGLPDHLLEGALVELRRKELIDVESRAEAVRVFATSRGTALLGSWRQTVQSEVTIPNVVFDAVTRRVVAAGPYSKETLMLPREVREAGAVSLPGTPNRYPLPEEISVSELDRVCKRFMRKSKQGIGSAQEILACRARVGKTYTLYQAAVLLLFDSGAGGASQELAIIVNGRRSDEHESRLATTEGLGVLRDALGPLPESQAQRLARTVPGDVLRRVGRSADAEQLALEIDRVRAQREDAEEELASDEPAASDPSRPDTRAVQRERIVHLEGEMAKLEEQRKQSKLQYLRTRDIRAKLLEAIETVQERLLIMSGFISSEVVDANFVASLRRAVQRGARIWIGYGFDAGRAQGEETRAKPTWMQAEAALKGLATAHPKSVVVRDVGDSHDKRVLCDVRFTMGGSFNFLSFTGQVRRGRLRHEGADYIEDRAYCEGLWEEYLRRFFT